MSNRVTVNVTDQRGATTGGHAISRWLIVGLTQRGPINGFTRARSLAQLVKETGDRVSYGLIYDVAEAFFRGLGIEILFSRVVGPAALAAHHRFVDASSNPALDVDAQDVGEWGNDITVQILAGSAGGTFVLKVFYLGVLKETSPDLANVAAAITWAAAKSSYIVVSDPGAVADPAVVAATALTAGTDDRTHVTTASWVAALARVPKSVGACNVSAPGATSPAVQQAVIDHCALTNRTPFLDSIPGADAATIAAQKTSLTGEGVKRTAILAPWATIPGLTPSSTRTVPYSAIHAANTARSDKTGGIVPNVNEAVAAENGYSDYATGLETEFSEADLQMLDDAQIIAAAIAPDGRVQTQGDRTLADPDDEPQWFQVQSARTVMYVADEAAKAGSKWVLKKIDPAGKNAGLFKGDLKAILVPLSPEQIGNDPATSVAVTQDTAARKFMGSIAAQPNQAAEAVTIDVIVEVS